MKKNEAEIADNEIAKRRDQALLRALSMPPKPHKAPKEKGGGPRKSRRKAKAG